MYKILSNFDDQFERIKSLLAMAIGEYQDLSKAEKNLSIEIKDICKELEMIRKHISESKIGQKDSPSTNSQEGQIALIESKLNTQENRVNAFHTKTDKLKTLSQDLTTQITNLDKLMSCTRSEMNELVELEKIRHEEVKKIQAVSTKCQDIIRSLSKKIENLVRKFDYRGSKTVTFEFRVENTTEEIEKLLVEIQAAKDVLAQVSSKDEAIKSSTRVSELLASVIELNQIAQSSEEVRSSSVWNALLEQIEHLSDYGHGACDDLKQLSQLAQNLTKRLGDLDRELTDSNVWCNRIIYDNDPDLNLVQNRQSSSLRQKTFKEITSLQATKLPGLQKHLEDIDTECNRVNKRPRGLGHFRYIDDVNIAEMLNKVQCTMRNLSQNLNTLQMRYKKLADEEMRTLKKMEDAVKWINEYESGLNNLEKDVSLIVAKQVKPLGTSETRQWITNNLQTVRELEERQNYGQILFQKLLDQLDDGSISGQQEEDVEIRNLKERLSGIKKPRLMKITENLMKIKNAVDHFELTTKKIMDRLTEFEKNVYNLQNSMNRDRKCSLEDILIDAYNKQINSWKNLLKELDEFKWTDYDNFVKHNEQTPMKDTENQLLEIDQRFEKIYSTVNHEIEKLRNDDDKYGKMKELLQTFIQNLDAGKLKFMNLTKKLQLDINEKYYQLKLSEQCVVIRRILEQTFEKSDSFCKTTLNKLDNLWTELQDMTKQCSLSEDIEETSIANKFHNFKTDIWDFTQELNGLLNEVGVIEKQCLNYEAWLTELEEKSQLEKEKIVTPHEVPVTSMILMKFENLPTDAELEQEVKYNTTKINQLYELYRKQLGEVKSTQKSLNDYVPQLDMMIERIRSILRRLLSLIIYKDRYGEDGAFENSDMYGVCTSARFRNELRVAENGQEKCRQLHDSVLQNVNQLHSDIQNKLNNCGRFIQAIKQVDSWHIEYYTVLKQWIKSCEDKKTNPVITNSVSTSKIGLVKFTLEMGNTYVQSVRDVLRQILEQEHSEGIVDLVQDQYRRANHILQNAAQHFEHLQQVFDEQEAQMRSAAEELLSTENWLKKWKEDVTMLRTQISATFSGSNGIDDMRKKESELDKLMSQIGGYLDKLQEKQKNFEIQLKHCGLLDQAQLSRLKSCEEDFHSQETLTKDILNNMKELRTKVKEFDSHIKKARQWIQEASEQLPKAREGRVCSYFV